MGRATSIHLSRGTIAAIEAPEGHGPRLVITPADGTGPFEIHVSQAKNPAGAARMLEAAAHELAERWEARGRVPAKCDIDPHVCELANGISAGETCERINECRDEIGGTR